MKVGFLKDSFDYRTVKRLCAESFGLSTDPDKLVLIHAGARVDRSAFPTLGQYIGALSPQQHAKFSLGVGEIVSYLYMYSSVHLILICFEG